MKRLESIVEFQIISITNSLTIFKPLIIKNRHLTCLFAFHLFIYDLVNCQTICYHVKHFVILAIYLSLCQANLSINSLLFCYISSINFFGSHGLLSPRPRHALHPAASPHSSHRPSFPASGSRSRNAPLRSPHWTGGCRLHPYVHL